MQVSLLLTVGVIILRTVFTRKIGANKLTFVPYYWAFGQLLIGMIYTIVYLSTKCKGLEFLLIWKIIAMQFSFIVFDGLVLTLALSMNLITALIRFQIKAGI